MSETFKSREDEDFSNEDAERNARLLQEETADRARDEMEDMGGTDRGFITTKKKTRAPVEREKESEEEKADNFLYNVTKDTAEYIRAGGFKSVVLMDRSARPFATALGAYWKLAFKQDKKPHIYFINPDAFKEKKSEEELVQQFKEEHPYLFKGKDDPTFVFDVCSHSGKTLDETKEGLDRAGFSKISYGLVFDTRDGYEKRKTPVDFSIKYNDRDSGCYMFGDTDFLMKGDKLHVETTNSEEREKRINKFKNIFEAALMMTEVMYGHSRDAVRLAMQLAYKEGATEEDMKSIISRKNALAKGSVLTDKIERRKAIERRKHIKNIIEEKFSQENS